MSKQNPPGRSVTDNGPATYNGPTGNPRIPKEPADGKLPDEIPGELVELNDGAFKISRDGNTITKEGCALIVSAVIQWGVPKQMSISACAKKLGIHRHTLTTIIRNYQDHGQIGAIKILDGVDIDDFNDIVADTLMNSFFDRQDIVEAANGELRRRLTEETETLSVKNLIEIQKTNEQMTLNAAKFLMEKVEAEKKLENKTHPVSTDQVSELRDIFATATKRLEAEEKKNIVIDG